MYRHLASDKGHINGVCDVQSLTVKKVDKKVLFHLGKVSSGKRDNDMSTKNKDVKSGDLPKAWTKLKLEEYKGKYNGHMMYHTVGMTT